MLIFFVPAGIEAMFEEMGANEKEYAKHPFGFIKALNEVGQRFGVEFFDEDEKD